MLKKTVFLLGMFIILFSCGGTDEGGGESGTTDDFDRGAMLIHLADNIIIPALEDFETKVTTLKTATESFTTTPEETQLEALQTAWYNAYKTWQYVEMFNIGKAEELLFANFINIYPVSETDIENNVASGDYDLEHPNNIDAQGFPALDYLLYGIGTTNTEIIEIYTTNENASGYITYLTDIVTRLETLTVTVVEDWNATYRDEFVASTDNTATSSVNKLVNDFIFYYEKGLRANKFGIPAGVFSTEPLAEKVEAFYRQDISKELALEALQAVEDFFNGNSYNGTTTTNGFKAYLEYLDRDDLVSSITSQITVAKTAINSLNDSFYSQITTDNTQMTQAYDELQKVVVLFKVDMLQAFDVSVDFIDADGD